MPRHEPPASRRCRPRVEGLEHRELMSVARVSDVPLPNRPTLTPSSYGPPSPGHGPFRGDLIPDGSPNFINQLQQQVYPNSTPYAGSTNGPIAAPANAPTNAAPYAPTDAELAREYFTSTTTGRYTITPGRFSNQQYTIHAFSKAAHSNQFLNSRAQLLIFTPQPTPTVPPLAVPPSLAPREFAATSGAYAGLAVFVPYNATTTSNELVFDLGPQASAANAPNLGTQPAATTADVGGLRLPTGMTWSLDPNGVGAFTSPSGFTQGSGTLQILYQPDAHPRGGAIQSGKITYVMRGLINTSSVLSAIEKSIN